MSPAVLWLAVNVTQAPKNLQIDQREPAWRPARAVSAAEMPYNIFHYVLETSGWHQLWLVVFTVAVFLHRAARAAARIVNDSQTGFFADIVLCAVYAGTVLLQGASSSSSISIAVGSASARSAICVAGCMFWLIHRLLRRPGRKRKGFRPR